MPVDLLWYHLIRTTQSCAFICMMVAFSTILYWIYCITCAFCEQFSQSMEQFNLNPPLG